MSKAASQPVLLLDSAAHGAAAGWRKGEDLIDALPYVDALPADLKKQVDTLLEEEMRRMTKRPADYLRELPPAPPAKFEGHPVLATEYERVKAKLPMPSLDTTRYRLDPPSLMKRNDYGEWKKALDNAHAQLEHQYNRILNLELMLKFGDKVWRAQTQLDESLVKQYESELADVKRKVTHLNTERKLQQQAAGAELRKLEEQYHEALMKNVSIEMACDKLEEEVFLLKAKLQPPQQQPQQQPQQVGDQESGQPVQEQEQGQQQGQADQGQGADGPTANGGEAMEQ